MRVNLDDFSVHNAHLESLRRFQDYDPQLRLLKQQQYIYKPELLNKIPIDTPGIYTHRNSRCDFYHSISTQSSQN